MDFRILGPLEVVASQGPITLGGAKRRGLLALLVVHAGQRLSIDRIVEALWGSSESRGAARTVQTYVSQLRGILDDPRVRLVAHDGGYTLDLPVDAVDATRFERLVRGIADIADPAERAERLEEALGMWRGGALEDFGDDAWAASERARLELLRLQAVEQQVEARLTLGHHRELIGDLEGLIEEQPFDERLWAHLVLAYYRSGRQADALRALQRLRTHLAEELGIDPSAELRTLERQVLEQDAALDLDVAQPVVASPEPATTAAVLPSGVVTFLLTDVEGSTALWERSTRAMAGALARHDAILADLVRRHRGHLLKTKGEGDATFSVFFRATDALAAAVAAKRALAAEVWPEGATLRVRMALATGEAVERDGDYYGTTVNRAARLRSLSRGGEVLLSHSTAEVVFDHLPDGVQLVDAGRRDLKDLTRPEHVWRLADPDEAIAPQEPVRDVDDVRVPVPPVLATVAIRPLVGRTTERDQLERAMRGNSRHVVWVRGEPGIGKTRLVAEVGHDAHGSGAVVLYGRCDEDLGAPYQPFVEALRHWADHVPATTVAAAAGHGLPELGRLLPEVADATVRTTPAGDAERYAVFEAVDGLLTTIATAAPIVLVLEDLHWADHSSLLLLRHLARSPRPARLTVIGTYRDTDLDRTHPLAAALADLRREGSDTRVDVKGLDASEVAQLVAGLGVDLDDAALASVAGETDGNPFFVTEVARHLTDVEPGDVTVPEGVREVVGRRLSRLSMEANDALTVAAVVGRDFDEAVVAAAGGPSGDVLRAALEEAARAHVLDEMPGTLGHYRFAHALIRQTLIAELSANRRVRLHWAAGKALRERDPTDAAAIAHHLAEGVLAGDTSTAADACLTAGDTAAATAAWNEAAAHYQHAIDVLDQASTDEPERRYRALMGLNHSAHAMLDYRRARRSYLDAATVAREHAWSQRFAHAVIRGIEFPSVGPALAAELELVEEALRAVGADDSVERARLLALRAATRASVDVIATQTEYEAMLDTAEAGLAMAERVGDPRTRLQARRSLTFVLAGGANARRYLTVAREMADILDDALHSRGDADVWFLHSVGVSLSGGGQQAGEPEAVMAGIALLEDQAARTETPFVDGSLLWARAAIALAGGRLAEAAECTDAVLGARSDLRYTLVHWDLTTMRAFVAGDLDVAVQRTTEALRDGPAAIGTFPELVPNLAAFLAATEEHERARDILIQALERGLPWDWSRQRALWSATEAATRLTDAAAASTLHALLEPYDGTILGGYGGWMIDGSAATSLGQLETVLGRYEDAEAHFRAGIALEERMGHTALVARSQLWRARMLLARDHADDHVKAHRLLDKVAATAERLGLGLLARDVAETAAASQ